MTLEFTTLKPHHITELTQIWTDGYQQGHAGNVPDTLMALRTEQSFRDRLGNFEGHSVIAIEHGKPTGFCLIRANEIYQFFVAKQAQGTKTAATLMQRSLAVIKSVGHTKAYLDVTPGNDRAKAFYVKMGFVDQGIQPVSLDTTAGPYVFDCFVMEYYFTA